MKVLLAKNRCLFLFWFILYCLFFVVGCEWFCVRGYVYLVFCVVFVWVVVVFPRWVWDYVRSVGGEVVADVRGWRFDVVGSRFLARPSISDVSSPCPSKRDVWLRRVVRVRVDGGVFVFGRAVHDVFLYPFRFRDRDVVDIVRGFEKMFHGFDPMLRGYRSFFRKLFRKALSLAMYSNEDGVPISVEPMIPGAAIGLSDFVKPDLLVGFLPVDISLASVSERVFERKEIALAGYALAIESWIGHPVDFAVALYIGIVDGDNPVLSWRIVRIDDNLRRAFLEARDRVAMILEHGEEPPIPDNCYSSCPYSVFCGGKR